MNYSKLKIQDAILFAPKKNFDSRGFFSRTFCEKEIKKVGINFKIKQCNLSFNKKKHTFRGMHYSHNFHKENKILCVVNGSIENYMIDLRRNSRTYLKKIKVVIDSKKNNLIYVPTGCANGFLTLKDNTLVHYYMDNFFSKKINSYYGIRYDDPFFKIKLKSKPVVISQKDKSFKNFFIDEL